MKVKSSGILYCRNNKEEIQIPVLDFVPGIRNSFNFAIYENGELIQGYYLDNYGDGKFLEYNPEFNTDDPKSPQYIPFRYEIIKFKWMIEVIEG